MDKVYSFIGIFGGAMFLVISSIIMLWRKLGTKVNWKSFNEKNEDQVKMNLVIIQRLTKVETKIEEGFKYIAEKIENGGK